MGYISRYCCAHDVDWYFAQTGLEILFFGGSKTNFVVAKLYVPVPFLRNDNILLL